MSRSPIYRIPVLYRLVMRGLYHPYYQTRLAEVAAHIEPGSSVVDLCAGDCAIYRYQLHKKDVSYLACDNSSAFLRLAKDRGIAQYRMNVAEETQYPSADVLLMMASLYQFIPQHEEIVRRMIRAASRKVIVVEPVRNWARSSNPMLRGIARILTATSEGAQAHRFTCATFQHSLAALGFQTFTPIAGGREQMAVLVKERV